MDHYDVITIELNIENESSLVIILAKDGTINRKGDGSYNIDKNFFMGLTDSSLFQNLQQYVTNDFKSFLGKVYDLPDKKGKNCSIEIVLGGIGIVTGKDESATGMRFSYGSDSMGPPKPVTDFVEAAIKLTDPWFYKQKAMINKDKPAQKGKKWWQFWK